MLRSRRFLAIICVAFGVACASPTLPLPPPSIPTMSQMDATHYTLSSTAGVEANALVILYNQNPAVSLQDRVSGVQADEEGNWTQTIVATKGDAIDITQEFGTTKSPPTTIELR